MTVMRRAAVAIACAVFTGSMAGCSYVDPRAVLDPVDGFERGAYLMRPGEEPVDVTESICPAVEGCERAAESDTVRLIRFRSTDTASAYVVYLAGAGYLSDRFVIEFRDEATTDERRQLVESMVDNTAMKILD